MHTKKTRRILLPALGEQQREETGMQVIGKVTWSESKGACVLRYPGFLYVYPYLSIFIHKGKKQPFEIILAAKG